MVTLDITLLRNEKLAFLSHKSEQTSPNVPLITLTITQNDGLEEREMWIDIPFDTLRGKLNELEMMTNPRISLP